MTLLDLQVLLRQHPDGFVGFVLPDGERVPAEFHLTEVGHVVRRFIDCGGTIRTQESCLLQVWVSPEDPAHRLRAGKLAGILERARAVVPSEALPVEVEYEHGAVAHYTIASAVPGPGELRFRLGNKHTDCLARELCGVGPAASGCGCGDAAGQCC